MSDSTIAIEIRAKFRSTGRSAMLRPIDIAALIAARGHSIRTSKDTIDRLGAGERIQVGPITEAERQGAHYFAEDVGILVRDLLPEEIDPRILL